MSKSIRWLYTFENILTVEVNIFYHCQSPVVSSQIIGDYPSVTKQKKLARQTH